MIALIQYVINGILAGSVYALLAISVTLVYGLTGVINFAIGEYLMVASYATILVMIATGNLALALGAALIAGLVVGLVTERTAFRFTYENPLAGFVVSLGLILALQGLVGSLYGPDSRGIPTPISGIATVGDLVARRQSVANAFIALITIAIFYTLLHKTRAGKALRAVADDRLAAAVVGVPVKRTLAATFLVGAVLAGGAGWIVATVGSVEPFIGGAFLLKAFAVALIGGLGNIDGAAVAGLGLGVVEHLAIGYSDPLWSQVYLYGLVVLVLLVRPEGLRRGVSGATL